MAKIPKKVSERLAKELPKFQKVLESAQRRDVNEADTVTIITDMLGAVFGFDKYTEITSEQAIRGTYCDLAVKIDDAVKYLIEVKAIGLELKDNHLRQAINYGANHGIPWIVLTNGAHWELYRIRFEQPISHDQVCKFDLTELSGKKADHQEMLYLLCREGVVKAAFEAFHERVQIVNRFVVGAILQSDAALGVVRRELRRLSPESKVSIDELRTLLPDVLKRDVLESDDAKQAKRRVARSINKSLRKKRESTASPSDS